jgi:hypothetical protein
MVDQVSEHSSDTDQGNPHTGDVSGDSPAVDIALLTEKVYRLMCAELRLERARGGGGFPRPGRQHVHR